MIYLNLFLGFLKVGCFAFGAYGAIPLIRDIVLSNGWLTDEQFTYIIAVSESSPGPIMVNIATYVGADQAGLLGAILATAGVVLPSFVIILIITALLQSVLKNVYVQAVLRGLKPCIIGIILATGAYLTANNCFTSARPFVFEWNAIILTGLLIVVMFGYRHWRKRKLSPITLILVAAVFGILFYGV